MNAAALALWTATLLDPKATVAQRNDACYALRGNRSQEAVAALTQAIGDKTVRACAARDLAEAGAVEALLQALAAEDPDTRLAAASELGSLRDPRALEPLGRAAMDDNLLVSAAAVGALGAYDQRALPMLLRASEQLNVTGVAALEGAARFHDPTVVRAARRVQVQGDVAAQVIALSVLMEQGDATDLPKLRELAAKSEPVASRTRGFGFMPVIDVGRAAKNAMEAIERKLSANSYQP